MEELLNKKEEMSMGIEELAKAKKELSTGEDLLVEEQQQPGPFLLEHFDSSEYSLAVPGEGTRPEVLIMPMRGISSIYRLLFLLKVESSWIDGLTSFSNISATFPWISTCRLMASDQDVGYLKFLPHLCHLEVAFLSFFSLYVFVQVEFSDDPGSGLLSLLNKHPNRANFVHLFLQVDY